MLSVFNIVNRTTFFFFQTIALLNVDGNLLGISWPFLLWYFKLRTWPNFCWLVFSFSMVALICRQFWFLNWWTCVLFAKSVFSYVCMIFILCFSVIFHLLSNYLFSAFCVDFSSFYCLSNYYYLMKWYLTIKSLLH